LLALRRSDLSPGAVRCCESRHPLQRQLSVRKELVLTYADPPVRRLGLNTRAG
jgi:hypothetical protein